MASSSEINNCRDIVPYVPSISAAQEELRKSQENDMKKWVLVPTVKSSQPLENFLQTTNEPGITPQELTGRKRRLVNAEVINYTPTSFIIVPSEVDAHKYRIKLNKNGEEANDPLGYNRKFHDMLHGWEAETRKRPSGHCDTFYYHETKRAECRSVAEVMRYLYDKLKEEVKLEEPEKRSKKRKADSSDSDRERETAKKKQKGNGEETARQKAVVEKFQDESYNNVMNLDNQWKYEVQRNVEREFMVGASETPSKKRQVEFCNWEGESAAKYQKSSEEPIIKSKLTPEQIYALEMSLAEARNNLMNLDKPKKFDKPSSSNVSEDQPILVPALFQEEKVGSSTNVLHSQEVAPLEEVGKEKESGNEEAAVCLAKNKELAHSDKESECPSPSELEKFDKPASSNVSMDFLYVPPLPQQGESESFANLDLLKTVLENGVDKENKEARTMHEINAVSKEGFPIGDFPSKEGKREEELVTVSLANGYSHNEEGHSGNWENVDHHEVIHEKKVDKVDGESKTIHETNDEKEEEKGEEIMIISLAKNDEWATDFPLNKENDNVIKEGAKTMDEDTYAIGEGEVAETLANMDEFDIFSRGLEDDARLYYPYSFDYFDGVNKDLSYNPSFK